MLTTTGKVRDVMGLGVDTGVDDPVITEFIRIAQRKIKKDVFVHHYDETPDGNWINGAIWNGSNCSFSVDYPIMDIDFDGDVDGEDITGYWFDSNDNPSSCSITINNSRYGHINIYQSNGSTAIPANAEDIKLEYYTLSKNVSEDELEDLCTYYACHLVTIALKEPNKITVGDFEVNKQQIMLRGDKETSPYKEMYEEMLRAVGTPRFKAT